MSQKTDNAMDFHRQGYNCAQAVALSFCEEIGLDTATVKRATEGFGAGMGGCDQTCGALSGAVFVVSLLTADPTDPVSKKATYAVCEDLSRRFVAACGSGICRTIKGLDGGNPLCSCDECIACGVRLVEDRMVRSAE